ncbi:hypothetical protein EV210_10116 [Anaerospora hongkongensis]|uniref:Uncharacterized protein n=1 Tax=Anaerospora hongkongensis TaxID=244830 RepID=A0A4R1QBL0_9FIRM|nr:hypothetical protein [Anaerospora hongkongensis]TCL39821.1 hypothetical protein EV210_10116 [Anaerospora hongkongensis]
MIQELPVEAREFIEAFLTAQYAATMAVGREDLDEEGFQQEVAKLNSYFKLDVFYPDREPPVPRRTRQPGEPAFAELAEQLQNKAVRKLFMVRAYEHPEWGVIYRIYVGTDRKKGTQYFFSYYIAKVAESYKIIAQYLINDSHTGWEWSQGLRLHKQPMIFAGVWHFTEPTKEKDQEDYGNEEGIDYPSFGTKQPLARQAVLNATAPEKPKVVERLGMIEQDNAANLYFARCLELLMGRFFTHGFFCNGSDPFAASLPWQELADAVQFSKEMVSFLREADCTALESEGDAIYFPFVYCGDLLLDGLPDFAANDHVPPGAVVKYDTLDDRECLFWYDDFAEDYAEDLDESSLAAFKTVHGKMKAVLKDLVEFTIVAGTECPVIIGGTFATSIFAGIITIQVQT